MEFVLFLAGLGIGLLAMRLYLRPLAAMDTSTGATLEADIPAEPEDDTRAAAETPQEPLFRLKHEIEALDEQIQRPGDLLVLPQFRAGTELLASNAFTATDVIDHLGGQGYVLPSMAAVALRQRADTDPAAVLATVPRLGAYALSFVIDYLQSLPDAAHLPSLLKHAREWWWDFAPFRQRLRDHLQWAATHTADAAKADADNGLDLGDLDESALTDLADILGRFKEDTLAPFLRCVETERLRRRERRVLGGFGRVVAAPRGGIRLMHQRLSEQIERLYDLYTGERPGPVLVAGEHGVGKTVMVDLLTERLHSQGWLIFEASAAEILAGQKYIGELEERIREMLAVLNRPRALWRVPDFYDLLHKGAHSQDPRGVLDLIMPAIERGELQVIGEITPRQLAQLQVARPGIKHRFEAFLLPPADATAMEEIAAQWAMVHSKRLGLDVADVRTLAEARRMAAQYFPEQHEPGRLLRLLDETLHTAAVQEPASLPLDSDALLSAIAARSGLPLDVIDDRQSLDLDALRGFFRHRVIGQDTAVECLLDRIAMLKAGLIDSGRPIGVFLFAGPTGTGKTELAKSLGELLFGSAERLLRLDMSEFQSEDALWRLTGDGSNGARSLTARIREQPFSVVLLDEFEKAHPKVWDLFLQVFDDARLSDRDGNTADFRHSIIILTSNVGSTLARNAGPGFTATSGGYSRTAVEKALYETFRREFLNRIDQVVLFNPLDRSLMREILHKELNRVLTRRGLRNRDWAVEWEPSAVEFLLDRGFTPDLGARPLRRAIEHHLLAPLARRIVEHQAPEGDQFLFVRSAGDRLEVHFIAPDASDAEVPAAAEASTADTADIDLRDLIYTPDSAPSSIARLDAGLERLRQQVESPDWALAREADFARMGEAGFWSESSRFEVLDRIERRDRIESALDSALRLRDRLHRDRGNAGFVGRLAQLLYLLDIAVGTVRQHRPQDALLEITASEAEIKRHGADARLWWQQLLSMYLAWAERRNMRVEALRQDPAQCRAWLAVAGFGALDILEREIGLHVLERESEDQPTQRISLQVRAAADLPGRPRLPMAGGEEQRICRRYRASPSPLVRDGPRGWRSGRLDRVLDGEFDVIQN